MKQPYEVTELGTTDVPGPRPPVQSGHLQIPPGRLTLLSSEQGRLSWRLETHTMHLPRKLSAGSLPCND